MATTAPFSSNESVRRLSYVLRCLGFQGQLAPAAFCFSHKLKRNFEQWDGLKNASDWRGAGQDGLDASGESHSKNVARFEFRNPNYPVWMFVCSSSALPSKVLSWHSYSRMTRTWGSSRCDCECGQLFVSRYVDSDELEAQGEQACCSLA